MYMHVIDSHCPSYRPASAPVIPPEGEQKAESTKVSYEPVPMQSPRLMKTYTMDRVDGPTLQTQTTHKTGRKTKPKARVSEE